MKSIWPANDLLLSATRSGTLPVGFRSLPDCTVHCISNLGGGDYSGATTIRLGLGVGFLEVSSTDRSRIETFVTQAGGTNFVNAPTVAA
jgi:hypothetical protein